MENVSTGILMTFTEQKILAAYARIRELKFLIKEWSKK
tara:strand:+ start:61 stop:174 length:114 start_codon:yes stop_codon:yes gene_type:complete